MACSTHILLLLQEEQSLWQTLVLSDHSQYRMRTIIHNMYQEIGESLVAIIAQSRQQWALQLAQ